MSIANKKFKSSQEANEYLLSLPPVVPDIAGTAIIYPCVKVGKNISIGDYSVIGKIGFGYSNGRRIPHIGGVILGDDVEIGSNTCIDRAKLENTIIGAGTKIDNLVHCGHSAIVGKHCYIVAGTVIGGTSEIGDNCFIGENVSIKDHVRIGKNCVIGQASNVVSDIPNNSLVYGNPAKVVRAVNPIADPLPLKRII